MSSLLTRHELTTLFNAGRFKKEPTLAFTTFIYHPAGIELLVSDTDMQEIGGCWERDVRSVLDFAQSAGERVKMNPNLWVFHSAVRQVEDQSERVQAALRAERAYKAREVISLYPNPNVY